MKMGMAATLLDPRSLIDVEERRADEEERRDDDAREEVGGPHRGVAEAAQDEREHGLGQQDDDGEREQGSNLVDEIGTGQLPRTRDGIAQRDALHDDDRHERREASKPGEAGQYVGEHEERDRSKHEPAGEPGANEPLS